MHEKHQSIALIPFIGRHEYLTFEFLNSSILVISINNE